MMFIITFLLKHIYNAIKNVAIPTTETNHLPLYVHHIAPDSISIVKCLSLYNLFTKMANYVYWYYIVILIDFSIREHLHKCLLDVETWTCINFKLSVCVILFILFFISWLFLAHNYNTKRYGSEKYLGFMFQFYELINIQYNMWEFFS